MRDDAYSEVLVGRVFVMLGVKFAERLLMGIQNPATTTAVDDLTVLRTPRGEWKIRGNYLPFRASQLEQSGILMSIKIDQALMLAAT